MPTVMSARPRAAATRRKGWILRGRGVDSGRFAASRRPFVHSADPVSGDPVQPVVRLRSAVCLLGRFPALAGVDLDVREGEVVLLSGGNGAGKTTLLRLLAGLVPLRAGTGEVLGHDLTTDRRGHRQLV